MVTYVPGTLETDPKKLVMSLQQLGPKVDTLIKLETPGSGLAYSSSTGALSVSLPMFTASLGSDVTMNAANLATYFSGPSVAQGSTGTWYAIGTVTLVDTAAVSRFNAKLWDGTTVIASAQTVSVGAGDQITISLSGYVASPAGNLRIDCSSALGTSKILFNATGLSKDSTITAVRIA